MQENNVGLKLSSIGMEHYTTNLDIVQTLRHWLDKI